MGTETNVRNARSKRGGLPSAPIAGETTAVPPPPAEVPSSRRRVLVVDDIAANRMMLQMFLGRIGFPADQASSGEEAVEMAGRNGYDAILMDLHMPLIDGYTAAQRIRAAEPAGRHTTIIAVTASLEKGTRERCLAAGMDDYFDKPLDLQRLGDVLTKRLRQ